MSHDLTHEPQTEQICPKCVKGAKNMNKDQLNRLGEYDALKERLLVAEQLNTQLQACAELADEMAKGYLAALEGPEVKALVEATTKVIKAWNSELQGWTHNKEAIDSLQKALAAFKQATGKEREGDK